MFHRLTAIGNLSHDPELRQTKAGRPVVSVGVGVTSRLHDTEERCTLWLRLIAFDRPAEDLVRYCKKGRQIYFEGSLLHEPDGNCKVFTKSDGTQKAVFDVLAHIIVYLGPKPE